MPDPTTLPTTSDQLRQKPSEGEALARTVCYLSNGLDFRVGRVSVLAHSAQVDARSAFGPLRCADELDSADAAGKHEVTSDERRI
jgi:hypothetical protein